MTTRMIDEVHTNWTGWLDVQITEPSIFESYNQSVNCQLYIYHLLQWLS